MIKIENYSVFFGDHSVKAVDNASLDVAENLNIVIIGETGSGKSVLLLGILGLLPVDASCNGHAWFDGKDLLQCGEEELNKIRGNRIGYIPQGGGGSMNPLMTTGFQVAEPQLVHRYIPKRQALLNATVLMRQFLIKDAEYYSKAYPHQFSGGMRQRTLLAMGISAEPDLILADEPTKGLDTNNIEIVKDCFCSLDKKTVICVTHDLRFAKGIADIVVVMYAAQIVEISSSDEFFGAPLHPYAQGLIAALPENGLRSLMGFAPEHKRFDEIGCRFQDRCKFAHKKCLTSPPLVSENNREVRCWLYVE
jgi:peptide/nickel transport system ATP-binding protein